MGDADRNAAGPRRGPDTVPHPAQSGTAPPALPAPQAPRFPPAVPGTPPASHALVSRPAAGQLGQGTAGSGGLPTFVHEYLRQFITVAEAKAGVVFTAAAGLLAYLEAQGALDVGGVVRGAPTAAGSVAAWAGLAAAVLFAAAGTCALGVVWPRLGVRSPASEKSGGVPAGRPGVIYWGEITAHGSAEAYAGRVQSLSDVEASAEVSRHNYRLAEINGAKYTFVTRSLRCFFAGVGVLFVFLAARPPKASPAGAPAAAPAPAGQASARAAGPPQPPGGVGVRATGGTPSAVGAPSTGSAAVPPTPGAARPSAVMPRP